MNYDIEARTLTRQDTIAVRARLALRDVGAWLPTAYRDVLRYLADAGVAPAGPPYARYTFHDDKVDIEAGFPVSNALPGDTAVVPSNLPAGPAAVTTHHGRYEDLPTALEAVTAWLTAHGHRATGAHWEVYHSDPHLEPDPARWRTDILVPYR